MTDTRDKLLVATIETLREDGIAALSARGIAARAGVNQALIFYHFKTVDALVVEACRHATRERVDDYRQAFAAAASLPALLQVGRKLHERERAAGNVTVMAQVMAGGQRNPALAEAAREALAVWTTEIEAVLDRLLATGPLRGLLDVPGLARAISAAFVGLELYDGVDPAGATNALDTLAQLGALTEVIDELGPVARRALRAKLRRAGH